MATPAIVLLAHGSPDPDWVRPLRAVRDRARAAAPGRTVELAFMDFIPPTLGDVVAALAPDHARIEVVAAFLSPGGRHLKHDVPALVEQVAAGFVDTEITLLPGALGEDPAVVDALAAAALSWPRTRPSGGEAPPR